MKQLILNSRAKFFSVSQALSLYHNQLSLKYFLLYVVSFFVLIIGCTFTLFIGDAPWEQVWKEAMERLLGSSIKWNPLLDERLPRLIVILSTGASLAVSGTVVQGLFQNPLASPSILGITCGASLFVCLIFTLGWHYFYPFAIPVAAFFGSIFTLLFVYNFSRARSGGVDFKQLILTGIATSTLLMALQGALLYMQRDQWYLIQTLTEWEAGSTYDKTWKHVHMQLPFTLIGIWGCWFYRQEINLFNLGEEEALSLGVDVKLVKWRLFLCISLLTAGAVAAIGNIAFFGLVLPNVLRSLFGPDQRRLIPFCAVIGATFMLFVDVLLRQLDLYYLSLGNFSSILGGIFFLSLLIKQRQKSLFFS